MLPLVATTRSASVLRVEYLVAEPEPALQSGTADMMDEVIGDIASDIPAARGRMANSACQYGVLVPRVRSRSSEAVISPIPAATTVLAPKRSLKAGVRGDRNRIVNAKGTNRTEAERAE